MGILGLTTFISGYSNRLLQNYNLSDCNLVIDGNSLAVQLYQIASKCNSAFGGNYDEYAKNVRKFFQNLIRCKIVPYVIFDGGYEERKMKTVLKRLRSRIADASFINPANHKKFLVFPLFLKDAFLEVVKTFNINYVFCEFEADHEIAAVARYLQCPVLSYDSDFFIYNVCYIPFPTVQLRPCIIKKDNVQKTVLRCKMYKVEYFLKQFRGLQAELMPLVATLLGNDYVKRGVFSKFYHNLKQAKSRKKTKGQCRISALIEWLKNESYDSAIEKVLDRFKVTQRNRIMKYINDSCYNYTRVSCSYLKYLGIAEEDSEATLDHTLNEEVDFPDDVTESSEGSPSEIASNSSEHTSSSSSESEEYIEYLENGEQIEVRYDWVVNILRKGKVSPRYYDLFHKSLYITSPQVEDFSKEDSNLTSLPILKYSFNVMTGFRNGKMYLQGRKNMKCKQWELVCDDNVSLDIWNDKNQQPSSQVFYNFLERTIDRHLIDEILKFPNNLQVLLLSILWMSKSKDSKCALSVAHAYSLVLCFIFSLVIKDKIGDIEHIEFNSKYNDDLKIWRKESKQYFGGNILNSNNLMEELIRYEDCMTAASQLLKYFQVDSRTLNTPKLFKRQNIHFFAQYQSCLQHLNYLNVLTSDLLGPLVITKSYNGTFLYNMYANLKSRNNPESYVFQLLRDSPTILEYFIIITKVLGYEYCGPPDTAQPKKFSKRKIKMKDCTADAESDDEINTAIEESEEIDDVNNKFNVLNFL